jgi:hypothetical protein
MSNSLLCNILNFASSSSPAGSNNLLKNSKCLLETNFFVNDKHYYFYVIVLKIENKKELLTKILKGRVFWVVRLCS